MADTSSAQALGYPCGNAAMLRERQQFSILAGSWLSGVFGEVRLKRGIAHRKSLKIGWFSASPTND
jgi:hypothetical protein